MVTNERMEGGEGFEVRVWKEAERGEGQIRRLKRSMQSLGDCHYDDTRIQVLLFFFV